MRQCCTILALLFGMLGSSCRVDNAASKATQKAARESAGAPFPTQTPPRSTDRSDISARQDANDLTIRATWHGPVPYSEVGRSFSAAGDINGDGMVDLIMGAPGDHTAGPGAGAVTVVSAAVSGSHSMEEGFLFMTGENRQDQAGFSVEGGGDANGDGYDDFLVSAPGSDSAAQDAGKTYLVLGPATGKRSLADAHATFTGLHSGEGSGDQIRAGTDLNHDGQPDLLIVAIHVDGDGEAELGIGAAYVVTGPVTAGDHTLKDRAIELLGQASSGYFGTDITVDNDFNGDGISDIAAGAPKEDCATEGDGSVYIIAGPITSDQPQRASLCGHDFGVNAGASLASTGDINLDGYGDILIGAPKMSTKDAIDAGGAYLMLGPFSGQTSLADAEARIVGNHSFGGAGTSVSTADLDGDDMPELVIGEPGNDGGGGGAGAFHIFSSDVSGQITPEDDSQKTVFGSAAGDRLGTRVTSAGTLNGLGSEAILAGVPGSDAGGTRTGAIYLLSIDDGFTFSP